MNSLFLNLSKFRKSFTVLILLGTLSNLSGCIGKGGVKGSSVGGFSLPSLGGGSGSSNSNDTTSSGNTTSSGSSGGTGSSGTNASDNSTSSNSSSSSSSSSTDTTVSTVLSDSGVAAVTDDNITTKENDVIDSKVQLCQKFKNDLVPSSTGFSSQDLAALGISCEICAEAIGASNIDPSCPNYHASNFKFKFLDSLISKAYAADSSSSLDAKILSNYKNRTCQLTDSTADDYCCSDSKRSQQATLTLNGSGLNGLKFCDIIEDVKLGDAEIPIGNYIKLVEAKETELITATVTKELADNNITEDTLSKMTMLKFPDTAKTQAESVMKANNELKELVAAGVPAEVITAKKEEIKQKATSLGNAAVPGIKSKNYIAKKNEIIKLISYAVSTSGEQFMGLMRYLGLDITDGTSVDTGTELMVVKDNDSVNAFKPGTKSFRSSFKNNVLKRIELNEISKSQGQVANRVGSFMAIFDNDIGNDQVEEKVTFNINPKEFCKAFMGSMKGEKYNDGTATGRTITQSDVDHCSDTMKYITDRIYISVDTVNENIDFYYTDGDNTFIDSDPLKRTINIAHLKTTNAPITAYIDVTLTALKKTFIAASKHLLAVNNTATCQTIFTALDFNGTVKAALTSKGAESFDSENYVYARDDQGQTVGPPITQIAYSTTNVKGTSVDLSDRVKAYDDLVAADSSNLSGITATDISKCYSAYMWDKTLQTRANLELTSEEFIDAIDTVTTDGVVRLGLKTEDSKAQIDNIDKDGARKDTTIAMPKYASNLYLSIINDLFIDIPDGDAKKAFKSLTNMNVGVGGDSFDYVVTALASDETASLKHERGNTLEDDIVSFNLKHLCGENLTGTTNSPACIKYGISKGKQIPLLVFPPYQLSQKDFLVADISLADLTSADSLSVKVKNPGWIDLTEQSTVGSLADATKKFKITLEPMDLKASFDVNKISYSSECGKVGVKYDADQDKFVADDSGCTLALKDGAQGGAVTQTSENPTFYTEYLDFNLRSVKFYDTYATPSVTSPFALSLTISPAMFPDPQIVGLATTAASMSSISPNTCSDPLTCILNNTSSGTMKFEFTKTTNLQPLFGSTAETECNLNPMTNDYYKPDMKLVATDGADARVTFEHFKYVGQYTGPNPNPTPPTTVDIDSVTYNVEYFPGDGKYYAMTNNTGQPPTGAFLPGPNGNLTTDSSGTPINFVTLSGADMTTVHLYVDMGEGYQPSRYVDLGTIMDAFGSYMSAGANGPTAWNYDNLRDLAGLTFATQITPTLNSTGNILNYTFPPAEKLLVNGDPYEVIPDTSWPGGANPVAIYEFDHVFNLTNNKCFSDIPYGMAAPMAQLMQNHTGATVVATPVSFDPSNRPTIEE